MRLGNGSRSVTRAGGSQDPPFPIRGASDSRVLSSDTSDAPLSTCPRYESSVSSGSHWSSQTPWISFLSSHFVLWRLEPANYSKCPSGSFRGSCRRGEQARGERRWGRTARVTAGRRSSGRAESSPRGIRAGGRGSVPGPAPSCDWRSREPIIPSDPRGWGPSAPGAVAENPRAACCGFTSPGGAPRESRFSAPQTALLKSLHPGLETRQKRMLRLETPESVGDCAKSWSAWLEEKAHPFGGLQTATERLGEAYCGWNLGRWL